MRYLPALFILAACSSATDTKPARYNFAVIDGRDQRSTAGDATLARPITAQLTRDPQGKFATRIFDFFAPAVAYAQQLTLSGVPVAGTIVCGREAGAGEPKVVPLCAYTLADGKAANFVQGGTKAGVYNILFTAQVPSQAPVADSTTVTVAPGPFASTTFIPGSGFGCWTLFPALNVKDQYGNAVPYRFVTKGPFAHVAGDVIGTEGARTLVADGQTDTQSDYQSVDVEADGKVIATGKLTVPNLSASCVTLNF